MIRQHTTDSIWEDGPFIRALKKVEIVEQNLSFKEVPATLVRFKGFLAWLIDWSFPFFDQCVREGAEGVFVVLHSRAKEFHKTQLCRASIVEYSLLSICFFSLAWTFFCQASPVGVVLYPFDILARSKAFAVNVQHNHTTKHFNQMPIPLIWFFFFYVIFVFGKIICFKLMMKQLNKFVN